MLRVPDWKLRLRGEVLGREALPALVPAWNDLCARAGEDNVYYSPRYARALIDHLEPGAGPRVAVVWQDSQLVALLPFTRARIELPFLGTAARAWQTDYTFSCTPLLDRERPAEAAAGLVELLGTINDGEWIIPAVNARGAACRAVIEALEKEARPWQLSNAFQRAMLETGGGFDEHMRTSLSSKRRRDLARSRRRLEEIGKVAHEIHRCGDGLTRAIEAFLRIEAGGWKGRHGTALACRPETRQFALAAFAGGASDSICRADVLTLNGMPIAVSLTVFAGNTGFTVKTAYDEAYRTCSAGLQLEVEVIRSFLTERWAGRLDAATAGEHVIDSLWPGRIEVADLLFTLAPRRARWRLAALAGALGARRAVKGALKNAAGALAARLGAD